MIQQKTIKKSTGGDFEPLEPDVYQVQITDVEEREGTKYASQDTIMQFMFRATVVEGDNKDKGLVIFTSQSWFDGGTQGTNPSKLFNLVKAVYAYYEKEVNVADMEEVDDTDINGLVGKQLRVTVAVTPTGKNKVTGFMPIKKEVKFAPTKAEISADVEEFA